MRARRMDPCRLLVADDVGLGKTIEAGLILSSFQTAGLDRRLFSKMVSYEGYAPSKETAIAVALAARLTIDEARDLLHVAGYALSDSIPADIVYAACFRHRVYERAHVRALLGEFSRGRIAIQNAL